jgi:maltooligosyltrehalose trehalohydrolase
VHVIGTFEGTLGAHLQPDGSTRFRVWAPDRARVEVVLETPRGPQRIALERDVHGYHAGSATAPAGTHYRYRLDGGDAFPDPCSRFQPEGPHGPSEVVDPRAFQWSDADFPGLSIEGQVLYELHVGAITAEGTYEALVRELPSLKALGVTCLELMPLNTFAGRFNWGYDGVSLFAPCAVYGRPDALRTLVDAAHRLGLAVILDVVYNHLGPSGNYLGQYARGYVSDRHPKDWGDPLDFDGEHAGPVRDFVIQNACQWIAEYHFDGLRLDATQSLYDGSKRHVVSELIEATRRTAQPKPLLLIAENEPQDPRFVRPLADGGMGADALWIDDFHHSARVACTGKREAYCRDYRGTAQELLSCALRNSLYQGQWYAWQAQRRGDSMRGVPAASAVFFLQNHDQVANALRGRRLHALAGPALARAVTTYFLLLAQTPLLFMGQEYFAPQPFLFFTDH